VGERNHGPVDLAIAGVTLKLTNQLMQLPKPRRADRMASRQ
jgi:hypothetical protein